MSKNIFYTLQQRYAGKHSKFKTSFPDKLAEPNH